jgi:hypothetical protein
MPSGIFIFTEEAEKGLEIKTRYPEDLKIEEKTLKILKISHSTNKSRSFSNLTIRNLKFASFYTGSNINYFISLLLKEYYLTFLFIFHSTLNLKKIKS